MYTNCEACGNSINLEKNENRPFQNFKNLCTYCHDSKQEVYFNEMKRQEDEFNSYPETIKPEMKFQPENRTKLGKIAHFSTLPYETCFQECSYCYSVKSVKMYPSVKKCYTDNTNRLNNGERLPEIPKNRNVVRMYVSGDFQSVWVISEWVRLARANKNVIFYGYTKQWKSKVEGMLPMLTILKSLPNVVLRASVDSQIGYIVPAGWTKAGIDDTAIKEKKHFICKSNKQNGLKCEKCKVCFSLKHQNIPVYFPAH